MQGLYSKPCGNGGCFPYGIFLKSITMNIPHGSQGTILESVPCCCSPTACFNSSHSVLPPPCTSAASGSINKKKKSPLMHHILPSSVLFSAVHKNRTQVFHSNSHRITIQQYGLKTKPTMQLAIDLKEEKKKHGAFF